MLFDISGLTFVITGAASGIGAATASLAAASGANVVVADIDDTCGQRVVDGVSAAGGNAIFSACDVTDERQVSATMALADATFGSLDVLHNNAGVADAGVAKGAVSLDELTVEHWDSIIAVNLRGPFLCAKAAVPYLRRSRNPSIINAVSIASWVARPSTLAYGASKGGLAQLTKGLALELADDGIRVNAYGPGMVETEMASRFLSSTGDVDTARRSALENYLVPALGRPEDIAHLVCFLASPQAAFINGAVWPIDGGMLAWRGASAERTIHRGSRAGVVDE
jgi:NAD(P)-dependent dehydrogenase (short-subunit alcohol dehydrogenase family)